MHFNHARLVQFQMIMELDDKFNHNHEDNDDDFKEDEENLSDEDECDEETYEDDLLCHLIIMIMIPLKLLVMLEIRPIVLQDAKKRQD